MKHIKEIKLNENFDPYFEGARTKIKELSEYFEIDEKQLMESIYYQNEENEKVISLAYSYGLI